MNFEEWFKKELEDLPKQTQKKLDSWKPEFRRVWNSAIDKALDQIHLGPDSVGKEGEYNYNKIKNLKS